MSNAHRPLTEAFHAAYDVKDANFYDEPIRMKAYAAVAAIENLMKAVGVPVPTRFDSPKEVS